MGGHCEKCERTINNAYHLALRHCFFLMVFMLPLLTAFPLLFFNQLAEDCTILTIQLCIWIYPSLFLCLCHEYCEKLWFYPVWAIGYVSLIVFFVYKEMSIYSISMSTVERIW